MPLKSYRRIFGEKAVETAGAASVRFVAIAGTALAAYLANVAGLIDGLLPWLERLISFLQ